MGERKDRPINLYRVVCRVTTDKEFYFRKLTSLDLERYNFNEDLIVDSNMSKMPIDIYGVTPLLVEHYAYAKYSSEWLFNETDHRFCMFNYMADSYDRIITFDTDDADIMINNYMADSPIIIIFNTDDADDMIDMLLETDLSREILMVDVPLFNKISVNKRTELCQMFNQIYIFSEYSDQVKYINITRYPNGGLYSTEIKPWRFGSQQIDMVRQENKMEGEIPKDTPILVNQFEYFKDGNRNTFAIIDFHTANALDNCVLWVVEHSDDPNNPNDAITKIYNNRSHKLYAITKWGMGEETIKREILMVPRTLFNKLDESSRRKLADMFHKIYVISFFPALDE